jgi:hypothetical protein
MRVQSSPRPLKDVAQIKFMANKLPTEKKVTVISMLAEGSSIRSIERITGVNRNTIMSLGLRVGQACMKIMDEKMLWRRLDVHCVGC